MMNSEPPRPSVLCIGALVQDTLAISNRTLQTGDDVPGRATTRPGGVATNIALALASTATEVALLSVVGDDAVGEQLITALEARGVDCTRVFHLPGASDQVVTLENPDGERFAAVADCQQIARLTATHSKGLLNPVHHWRGHVVIDSNLPLSAQEAVLHAATGAVTLVPASLEKAAQITGLLGRFGPRVIVNLREANAVLGADHSAAMPAAGALHRLGAREAIVTNGPHHAALANANGLCTAKPDSTPVRSTTGAGDAFVAGVLSADGLPEQARLCAAIAAATRHLEAQ